MAVVYGGQEERRAHQSLESCGVLAFLRVEMRHRVQNFYQAKSL